MRIQLQKGRADMDWHQIDIRLSEVLQRWRVRICTRGAGGNNLCVASSTHPFPGILPGHAAPVWQQNTCRILNPGGVQILKNLNCGQKNSVPAGKPGGDAQCAEKASQSSRPQARKNGNLFSPATQGELPRRGKRGPPGGCASEKTLLRPQVWDLSA